MRLRLHFPFYILLFTSFAWAQTGPDPIAQRLTFVSESTYTAYLKRLEAFGTRHAGQPNRDTVAQWIAQRFMDAGISDVVLDSFSVTGLPQWNVVATIVGNDPIAGEIVIGAHYDSQSSILTQAPGADDNASGTAAVLEMARTVRATLYQPRRTLRFIAFGAEELGLHGSEWYASGVDAERRLGMLMLNFDMIGHRRQDTTDRDVHIVYYDHAIAEAGRAVSTATTYTTLTPITTTQHRPHSDSWPFATRGIRCVFYIERDFSPYYHSPRDSSTHLDMAYATEVTKAGLAMVLSSDAPSATNVASGSAPGGWELLQNYPNPFNGETVIGYWSRRPVTYREAISLFPMKGIGNRGSEPEAHYMPRSGIKSSWGLGYRESGLGYRVAGGGGRESGIGYGGAGNDAGRRAAGEWARVSVYDLLGREIAVLVEGELTGGYHEVRWNASAFPSGVYVVKLATVDASGRQTLSTRRMVLMK